MRVFATLLVTFGTCAGTLHLPLTKHKLRMPAKEGVESKPASVGMVAYTVNLTLGTPEQTFRVSIDTGSGPFWVFGGDMKQKSCRSVPGHHYYDHNVSSTYVADGTTYEFDYAAGSIKGFWSKDLLQLGEFSLPVSFGESLTVDSGPRPGGGMTCFHDFSDGLMGLVPHGKHAPPSPPNVVDSLFQAGRITNRHYAFAGKSFLLGGDDASLYEGDLSFHKCSGPGSMLGPDDHWVFRSYGFFDPAADTSAEGAQLFATMMDTGAVATHGAAWAIAPAMNKVAAALAGRDRLLARCNARVIASLPTVTFYMWGQSFDMYPEDYVFVDDMSGDCVVGFQVDPDLPSNAPALTLGDTFIQAHYMSCHIDAHTNEKEIAFAPLKERAAKRARAAERFERAAVAAA